MTWKAGDVGWYVPTERYAGSPREIVVRSVGRRWAKFDRDSRFDIETGWVDAGEYISPGKVYRSRVEHAAEHEIRERWRGLKRRIEYRPPDGITVERIAKAEALLFGDAS